MSKMLKSGYFQSFHFCSSVLQTHNRNQYGFCLSDQLKIIFICKNLIWDFGSKFGPNLGRNMGKIAISQISTSVL